MSESSTRGERLHIGIFGRRNAGKSSLINAITGQDIALVSDVAGTTTDPVYKSMEILPIGPVVLIDTAGLDDTGELGEKRVKKSFDVLNKCDLAIIVYPADSADESFGYELDIVENVRKRDIPFLIAVNKTDAVPVGELRLLKLRNAFPAPVVPVSALDKTGIDQLKKTIIDTSDTSWRQETILGDIIVPGDIAVLVVPIDDAAPKGRLILPQVQTIRDILDHDAMAYVVKERELAVALREMSVKPKIVVTDSQVFQKVAADTPENILMTSFSILFARYKGDLEAYIRGINRIKELKDGDKVLIAEACTHHVQSDDIGTVKIPRWIRQITGRELVFEKTAGYAFPENLEEFSLVIHCGSCMLNRRETLYRIRTAESKGVPITNYGMSIAYSFGILERALKPFPLAQAIYNNDYY